MPVLNLWPYGPSSLRGILAEDVVSGRFRMIDDVTHTHTHPQSRAALRSGAHFSWAHQSQCKKMSMSSIHTPRFILCWGPASWRRRWRGDHASFTIAPSGTRVP